MVLILGLESHHCTVNTGYWKQEHGEPEALGTRRWGEDWGEPESVGTMGALAALGVWRVGALESFVV